MQHLDGMRMWKRQMGNPRRGDCAVIPFELGFVLLTTTRGPCWVHAVIILCLWLLCLPKVLEFGPHSYISSFGG